MRLPLHVLVHMYDHLQGASEQYLVQLLIWIPLMYVRCVFVQYVAVCHSNMHGTTIKNLRHSLY